MGAERSIRLPGRLLGLPTIFPRYVAAAVLGLLAAVALMVVARRFAGALAYPLEPSMLLVAGASIAAAGVAIRVSWGMSVGTDFSPWLDRGMMMVTSLSVTALAIGLCLPGTPLVGMFLFCTLLGVEESWAWARYFRRDPPPPAPRLPSSVPRSFVASVHDFDVSEFPDHGMQQLTRSQAADGTEEFSGWLRSVFTAGQRTSSVHVAFCPPFAATPELEVEQMDGPEARIKTAQLLPYGVRLDLKLAAVAEEPTNIVLQFAVRTARKHDYSGAAQVRG